MAALTEPLSTVVHGARQASVFPGESAVVVGAGPIGAMFCALLDAGGATVTVIEPTPERARLARDLGAASVVTPDEIEDLTPTSSSTRSARSSRRR